MRHNKYVCENPVEFSIDGEDLVFTLVDCRPTGKEAIRSILNDYACNYIRSEGIETTVGNYCCNSLPFTFVGNTARLRTTSLSFLASFDSDLLTFDSDVVTFDLEP